MPYRFRFERGRQANVRPAGLVVRLCQSDDVTCAEPMLGIPQPDASGLLVLELDASFRGYLELDAPDYLPSVVFFPRLVVWPPETQIIRMLEQFDLGALLSSAGIPNDTERGFAIMLTTSCLDQRAAGVTLSTQSADALTVAYYYRDGRPSSSATHTDEQGAGGWSRLPPGPVLAEARRASFLEFVGAAEFQARPGYVSYVPIGPTPSR